MDACNFRLNEQHWVCPLLFLFLDSVRALTVVKILNQLAQEFRIAIIVVTHDEKIIPTFKRIYHIRDGRTYEETGEGRVLD